MQSDNNQVYKLTAARTGREEKEYKDIGKLVFSELYTMIRKPPSLIIKLKGVGFWYLRKKRVALLLEVKAPFYDEDILPPEYLAQKDEGKREFYNLLKERFEEYNKYSAERIETRKIRNEIKSLLETPDKQEGEEEVL